MVARSTPEKPLATADWLISHLGAPDVRVLDCTYATTFKPGEAQTGKLAYDAHHIPGARYFDIDDIADADSSLPHMLPSPEKFASRARRLGLGDGHRIICYDQNGYLASARVWWMFRAMGHADVAVLDGGFEAWRAAGGAIEDLPPTPGSDRHFTARFRGDLVRDLEQMKAAAAAGAPQIVDARAAARFNAEVDEPRPGLRRGRIPGSRNTPYGNLLEADGRFKSPDAIAAVFAEAGVDLARPIVNTCGSGVTAAILALGQAVAGHPDAAVYDGSWTEWGAPASGAPVEPA
jgi:thiosulfate/3-mercaptopyruvate sulfurtransferase